MSERLVVEKGPRQRRVEGVLYFVLPPLIGAASRALLGPGLWQIPAILFAFVVLSLVGNSVAIRLGGELISPAERWRRTMERLRALSLRSMLFWMFLFYLLLFLGLDAPMIRMPFSWDEGGVMLGLIFSGAVVSTGLCGFYLRKQAATLNREAQIVAPPQAPWPWLAKSLPFNFIGVAGIAIGYAIGSKFSDGLGFLAITAGAFGGLIVQTIARSRLAQEGPVLWHNFGFGAAIAAGASSYGIYFATLVGCMELLFARTSGRTTGGIVLFALGGFVAGILFALIPWALARFNSVNAGG